MTTQVHELDEITQRVREQYTDFPYPLIADDRVEHPIDFLGYIRLNAWPQRKDMSGVKILDAGCGTGRTIETMTKTHPDADILGIDISPTSLAEAAARAERNGFKAPRLRELQVYDVAELGEQFDIIVCTGVLHHLSDPVRGLRALTSVLKPDGVLWIMVYALHGRVGVYMMQDLLKMADLGETQAEKVPKVRRILEALHEQHIFRPREWGADLGMLKDAGLVDLLLHQQDRAYTVPQIYEWLDTAGAKLLTWCPRTARQPDRLTKSPLVRQRLAGLDDRGKAAAAEMLLPKLRKHTFLAVRQDFEAPLFTLEAEDWLDRVLERNPCVMWDDWKREADQNGMVRIVICKSGGDYADIFRLLPWQATVLQQIDGQQPLRDIVESERTKRALEGTPAEDRRESIRTLLIKSLYDEVVFTTS